MEEEKAAAYYDELTRKGEGAARFKQGLGFSSNSDNAHSSSFTKGSSSTSFLSSFVKASSPSKASQFEKQAQLETIQNKLKKKPDEDRHSRVSETSNRDRDRDRDRDRERHSRRRSRSRERHRDRDRERDRDTHRDKDRERDRDTHRDRDRDRERERDRDRERRRRRSRSPREKRKRGEDVEKKRNGGVDYSRLIEGYDNLTPAERVKAKMKLQLAETAEKDATKGMGSGWERFDFDKDAPLDDEEIEAAEDDVALVKNIGQSFRFSAVEARREEQIKAAHDEAMFGVSSVPPSISTESEPEVDDNKKESSESGPVTSLLSEKVLAKQQGSWRDRARKSTG